MRAGRTASCVVSCRRQISLLTVSTACRILASRNAIGRRLLLAVTAKHVAMKKSSTKGAAEIAKAGAFVALQVVGVCAITVMPVLLSNGSQRSANVRAGCVLGLLILQLMRAIRHLRAPMSILGSFCHRAARKPRARMVRASFRYLQATQIPRLLA